MINANLAYFISTPILTVISFGICMWIYNRDMEQIIRNSFKKALKDVYKESQNENVIFSNRFNNKRGNN